MNLKKICILLPLLATLNVFAQDNGIYSNPTPALAVAINNNTTLALPQPGLVIAPADFWTRRGNVKVKTAFLDGSNFDYKFSAKPFKISIVFKLEGVGTATPLLIGNPSYTITIDNNNPEGDFYKDLKDFITTSNWGFIQEVSQIKLTIINVIQDPNAMYTYNVQALSKLKLIMSYEILYGIRPINSVALYPTNLSTADKSITLTWNDAYKYPNYEVQLLKLANKSPAKISDETSITTDIDWNKAIKFVTTKSVGTITLNPSEGQGFYAWRVRPLGTFYGDGLLDSRNFGPWSNSSGNATDIVLSTATGLPSDNSIFYYIDKDLSLNYIYSKSFSEQNKTSEKITYATALQQPRQTQVLIPSKNTVLYSQTLQDKSGRQAISTVPVPITGNLTKFKPLLASQKANQYVAYKRDDFDADATLAIPNMMQIGDGLYYSNTNANLGVPTVDDYGFSRTTYTNDGSNRVSEQSGVGKTHMIGSQASGMGRTVKTYYGTPTSDELVVLFGDEAPNPEQVQKVVTIDQNNTASTSYITREGKVIATSASINTNTTLSDLATDDAAINSASFNVKDKLVKSVKTEVGFVSSKRVVIEKGSNTLTINYTITAKQLAAICGSPVNDCDYNVTINVISLETLTTIATKTASSTAFTSFVVPIPNAGSYIIEKILTPGTAATTAMKNEEKKKDELIKPLTNIIADRLSKVSCDKDAYNFFKDLFDMRAAIEANKVSTPFPNPLILSGSGSSYPFTTPNPGLLDDFIEIIRDNSYKNNYSLTIYNAQGTILTTALTAPEQIFDLTKAPSTILVHSPCCDITLNVSYTPPFRCPTLAEITPRLAYKDGVIASNPQVSVDINAILNMTTNYLPDFEGYALYQIMSKCGILRPQAEDLLYKKMMGWQEPGTFNRMIFHMMTDQYNVNGLGTACSDIASLPATPADPVDNCAIVNNNDVAGAQYKCKNLANCWMIAINAYIANMGCSNNQLDMPTLSRSSPSDQYDTQKNHHDPSTKSNGDVKDQDTQFDEGFDKMPWLLRTWIKLTNPGGLSAIMRGKQSSSNPEYAKRDPTNYKVHLVNDFLNCTGYKFADILDPNISGYPLNSVETRSAGNPFSTDPCFKSLDYDFTGTTLNKYYQGDVRTSTWWNQTIPTRSNLYLYLQPKNYSSIQHWKDIPVEIPSGSNPVAGERTMDDMFPNIKDPIYAFKYYEYVTNTYRKLEINNCFSDPNKCWNGTAFVPCCSLEPSPDYYCNFCDKGIYKCPYTKSSWAAGHRLNFYNQIKSYIDSPDPVPRTYPTPTCAMLSNTTYWFRTSDITVPTGKVFVSYDNQYVSKLEIDAFNAIPANSGTQMAEPSYDKQVVFADYTGSTTNISYTRRLGAKRTIDCETKCESRRGEFRSVIEAMLVNERCYVKGCKLTSTDNIYSDYDLDMMADAAVKQCSTQCPVTTYTCLPNHGCRDIYALNTDLTGESGTELVFGVGTGGSYPAGTPTGPEVPASFCAAGNRSTGVGVMAASCTSTNQTFAEYTLNLQATTWTFAPDFPSKCNISGQYSSTGTLGYILNPDPVARQTTPYILQAGTLCPTTATPANATFMKKSDYVKSNNIVKITDGDHPQEIIRAATSPKFQKTITVTEP